MDRYRGTQTDLHESFTIMRLAVKAPVQVACIFGSSWQDATSSCGLVHRISAVDVLCQQWNVEDLRLDRAIFLKIATTHLIRCDAMVSTRLLLSSGCMTAALTCGAGCILFEILHRSHFPWIEPDEPTSSDTAGTWQAYIKRLNYCTNPNALSFLLV